MHPQVPFIVGVPRSGTTLLRLMLDAHPELSIPPETGFIPDALKALAAGPADPRAAFCRTVTLSPAWDDFNLRLEEFRTALAAIEPFDLGEGVRAFYRAYASRFGKPRWGDKTPGYGTHLDPIQSVLPEARFIHIIRDGRDAALSITGLWFAPGGEIEALAADWRTRILRTRKLAKRCAHYLEIRYERLIADAPLELRRVCEFIGLPYDPGMERYHESARSRLDEVKARRDARGGVLVSKEERLSQQRLACRPPDPSRVLRWKRDMGADMRERFEAVAGDLLQDLGYETGGPAPAASRRRLSSFLRRRRPTRGSASDP